MGGLVMAVCLGTAAQAQDRLQPVNTYGVPGLIDMPTAFMQPDGELTTNLALMDSTTGRLTFGFQITPRLQGIFRYSTIPDFLGPNTLRNYDRSFDLRYQLLTETDWRPAVTVGLQDFGGTGIYAGEYVVASKNLNDRFAVTGGIGWGRLGSYGSFENPLGALDERFNTRPAGFIGTGGQFETNQWFRGPAALFGGVSYRYSDKLTFKAEYSSDAYTLETARGINEHKSPVNIGFSYDWRPGVQVSGYTLLGSEVGLNLTFALNPKRPAVGGSGLGTAPQPVQVRPARAADPIAWDTAWAASTESLPTIEANIRQVFGEAGLVLDSYKVTADSAEVRFRNQRYRSQAQAIGRAARGLTLALPASVETFVLVPLNAQGVPGTAVRMARSDVEELENAPDGAWSSYVRAEIFDAATLDTQDLRQVPDRFPDWRWNIGPYAATSLFDPDSPIRLDVGLELNARYEPRPGLVFSTVVQQPLLGNRDESTRVTPSLLPRVRSDSAQYNKASGPHIKRLTGEYFFRPGPQLYGRVTAGLLETMYGGISAELLWRPENSRLAFGAEINRVRQRDFDQQFGFQDYEITTGHVSAYLSHRNGFHSQLDMGRYLAGDDGFTYTLHREFKNGWKVGGYFTLTDVSAETFGEGSFDKGITVEIPMDWVLGRPTRNTNSATIQPVLRDGGARLSVENRLYDLTRDQTNPVLSDTWARVWR